MRIQLSKHFEKIESPFKAHMESHKQSKRETRGRKFSHREQIEMMDTLDQFNAYKGLFNATAVIPKSKAYLKMKRVIADQDRRLKHVRLEEIKEVSSTVRTEFPESIGFSSQGYLSTLPDTSNLFKNQFRDTMLHQNSLLNKTIESRVHSIDDTIRQIKGHQSLDTKNLPTYESELNIDAVIELHKQRNRKLISSLRTQKKEIKEDRKYRRQSQLSLMSHTSRFQGGPKHKEIKESMSVEVKRLRGMKEIEKSMSPSKELLSEITSLKELKDKKEVELDTLLQNEFENKDRNKSEKVSFYADNMRLRSLNFSNQFKMRKIMNNKLLHRIKASKDQSFNFGSFLIHLKENRVIVCEELQQIFETLRLNMIGGKLLREEDFTLILHQFRQSEALRLPANISILKKVKNMMI